MTTQTSPMPPAQVLGALQVSLERMLQYVTAAREVPAAMLNYQVLADVLEGDLLDAHVYSQDLLPGPNDLVR